MLNKTICLVFFYPKTLRDHPALDNLQAWTSLLLVREIEQLKPIFAINLLLSGSKFVFFQEYCYEGVI